MKRISTIIVAFLLLISLVACTGNKLYAKAFLDVEEHQQTAITIKITLEDPDEQLEGSLNVYIQDAKGKTISNQKASFDSEEDELRSITFRSLTADTQYQIIIEGTYKGKPRVLYSGKVRTQSVIEQEIHTVEDFLAMSTRYGKYILMNDLDFEGADTKSKVTTFNSEFDGQGFSIKNYKFTNNTVYSGLFGTLSSDAKISNLTIDGMEITTDNKITSNRSTGILFGRSTNDKVEVSDITIKNSKITYDIDMTSNTSNVHIGLLGGDVRGTFTNITIDELSEINLSINKYANVYVGGLFGHTREEVKITDINNAGNLNIDVEQDGTNIRVDSNQDKTIKNNLHSLYIGGLIGQNNSNKLLQAFTYTNINYNELMLYGSHEPKRTTFETHVGGLFGESGYAIKKALYSGDIKVDTLDSKITTAEDNSTTNSEIRRSLYVGGISGSYIGRYTQFDKIVRSESTITINTLKDDAIDIRFGTLMGLKPYSSIEPNNPNELESFKVHGSIVDNIDTILQTYTTGTITDLDNYFEND